MSRERRVLVSKSAVRSGRSARSIAEKLGISPESVLLVEQNEFRDKISSFQPEVIWCNFDCKVDEDLVCRCPHLEVVATTSTGVSHIESNLFREERLRIIHLESDDSGLNEITSTADLSVALITGLHTGLLKSMLASNLSVSSLTFSRTKQIRSITIGLVGVGRIGLKVGEIMSGFGCRIIYSDISSRRIKDIKLKRGDWEAASLQNLFQDADLVSIHANEHPDRIPIIGATELNLARNDLKLINTSRESVLDTLALIDFLEANPYSAYATDVGPNLESVGLSHLKTRINTLRQSGRYFSSPHIGGASQDAASLAEEIILRKIKKALS